MSRPSKFGGRMGHSFDSEGTSVLTSPPLSPPRDSQYSQYGVGHQQPQPPPQQQQHHHQHHYTAARHSGNVGRSDSAGGAVPPMYYVQSPSRESFTFNDHDSFSQSFAAKSSPGGSPLASPLHKSYGSKSYQQHQQQPYQEYYGGNPRPGSRRVLPQPSGVNGGAGAASGAGAGAGAGGAYPVVPPPQHHHYQHQHAQQQQLKKGYQPWNVGSTIHEEDESYYQGSGRRVSKWCAVFLSIVFALICAVIVGFVYWLVCRPSAPRVEVKRIDFQSFSIAGGNDPTGVPTEVLTVNCTAVLNFGNPSKYFGFHVSAPTGKLLYEQIVVADGESHKFFQKKRSSKVISVDVHAARNPVYGAGPYLMNAFSSGDGLPLHLQIRVQSEAHVIWKVVKSRYKSNIGCDVVLNGNGTTTRTGMLKLLSQDCKHHKK